MATDTPANKWRQQKTNKEIEKLSVPTIQRGNVSGRSSVQSNGSNGALEAHGTTSDKQGS